jgi:hypothetical protein
MQYKLKLHRHLYLLIVYNSCVIIAPFNLLCSDNIRFTLQLPEKSYALNHRQFQRYPCKDVSAELIQSDFVAVGELMDFSSSAFRIKAISDSFKHNNWFNPAAPASIRLFSNDKMLYSESCRCVRWLDGHDNSKEIVFATEAHHVSRFPAKRIRNPRRQIHPPLTAVFDHPLIKKTHQRDIFDISSTGFSIRNETDDDIFFSGLIIPCLSIYLSGIPIASCTAQIIYRRVEDKYIHYGVAFLDMDIHSYSRINHLLCTHIDPKISVSTEIETDALWEFFFHAGFIYPEKYDFCQTHRENFIETYRKLYQENPEIARHITYEKNGRIYGHLSMIRAYERTWLIHHHAAMSVENKLSGFVVLRQMMLFLNGMYQFSSARMDYVICYFRPENNFPNRVFGGFARDIDNHQACSLDLFKYLALPITSAEKNLPDGWLIRESTPVDLWELEQFYKENSGGLFLNVLRSGESGSGDDSLEKVFERLGFLRRWRTYSLLCHDQLKAVFIVNQSDLAINMSGLLNCIKVLILDSVGLPFDLLSVAASILGGVYNLDKVTLVIYPAAAIEPIGISHEKQYQLWILNLQYLNQFMGYVQKKFRMKYD